MAKDISLKSDTKPPKRKKLVSAATNDTNEQTMDTKVAKKRKKIEAEVSTVCYTSLCVLDGATCTCEDAYDYQKLFISFRMHPYRIIR